MTIEEQLKKRLGVPENWDKHDYEHGRYSFNYLLEIAEEVVKANSVLGDFSNSACKNCGKPKQQHSEASGMCFNNGFTFFEADC